MKYLLIILSSISLLNSSMLLDSRNVCIEDFYTQNNIFYYLQSNDNSWHSISIQTTSSNSGVSEIGNYNVSSIQRNFFYDSVNNVCIPNASYILGMNEEQYNFLLALCGLIFGAVFLFFTVEAFVKVGKK